MSKYKLVPVEPTEEMLEAGLSKHWPQSMSGGRLALLYRAILEAAPSPEWVKTSDRLPTREDADEDGSVWVWPVNDRDLGFVVDAAPYEWVSNGDVYGNEPTHWMPKPRVQPPEPPEVE